MPATSKRAFQPVETIDENVEYIATLDIGSSKISLSVAQAANGRFEALLGVVHRQCQGITAGRITNLEAVTGTIRVLLQETVEILGFSVTEVYVGITDPDIAMHRNTAMVPVAGDSVTQEDIEDVLEAAETAMPLRENEYILHVIPECFKVNGIPVEDPVGRAGVRVDVDAAILTVSRASVASVERVCQAAGLSVRDIFFAPIGTLQAVTQKRQRQLGVLMLDIGAQTTDVIMVEGGRIRHVDVVPMGGKTFTDTLATGLRCLAEDAEIIKLRCGAASPAFLEHPEKLVDPKLCAATPVTLEQVAHLLETRIRELLLVSLNRLHYAGISLSAPHSIVITGGSAQLPGLRTFIQDVVELPVEIGFANLPQGMFDLARTPVFSSAVGLTMYAAERSAMPAHRMDVRRDETKKSSIFKKMADFFGGFFD